MQRSLTAAADGSKVVNSARISETCWLYDEQNKFMADLSQYVGAITRTNVKIAEPWQVSIKPACVSFYVLIRHRSKCVVFFLFLSLTSFKIVNYGIGGYYAPQHDFLYVIRPFFLQKL